MIEVENSVPENGTKVDLNESKDNASKVKSDDLNNQAGNGSAEAGNGPVKTGNNLVKAGNNLVKAGNDSVKANDLNEDKNVSAKPGNQSNKSGKNGRGRKHDNRAKKRQWEFNRRDDSAKRVRNENEERVKRRKYLMVLGYCGSQYIGMQRNPDVNTIEEELLKALRKTNLITEEGFQQPQYTHFQRAARTDKGVSAARQCISLKLPEQIDIDALNKELPTDIKVFGYRRVTKGFNCKDQCDARTYSYTLPSISFAPHDQKVDMKTYRVDEATLARVNDALKLFLGSKNFHNFTSRKKFEDPSARRFILDFRCEPPFMVDDVEFCTIIVKGQSFMMHQIRKMIGLTLAVVRGVTSVDTITRSFEKARVDIPMAPGLGLVLDQVHYDGYNARFKDDGMHEQLEWNELEPAIQEFRDKFIHPVIKETELKEQPMIKWLETLTIHTYDDRPQYTARNALKSTDENEEEPVLEGSSETTGMDTTETENNEENSD